MDETMCLEEGLFQVTETDCNSARSTNKDKEQTEREKLKKGRMNERAGATQPEHTMPAM